MYYFSYNTCFTFIYRFPLEKSSEWYFGVKVWSLMWFLLHIQACIFELTFCTLHFSFIVMSKLSFFKSYFICAMGFSMSLAFLNFLDSFLRVDLCKYNYLNKWYDKSYDFFCIDKSPSKIIVCTDLYDH